jgi:hypothetical protein
MRVVTTAFTFYIQYLTMRVVTTAVEIRGMGIPINLRFLNDEHMRAE